ncbi:MAG: hypothetical protein WDM77_13055 [Steroidobacteraceae bacterium]
MRFGSTLLGSRAVAGSLDLKVLEAKDRDGISMAQALRAFGLEPAKVASAARRREELLAYVELHIEQGPVLEQAGVPVGCVTSINGATRLQVCMRGMAGHAGYRADGDAPGRAGRRGGSDRSGRAALLAATATGRDGRAH